MGNCMGLILDFDRWPSPRRLVDVANDGVVRIDRDVLDGDLLLSGSAMTVKPFRKYRQRTLCFVSHLQVAALRREVLGRL